MNLHPKIKIAIIPRLGIFNAEKTSEGDLVVTGGYESELLRMLLKGLELPYQLLVPEDGEWGVQKNGTWTGITGMVARNEVDMAVGGIFLTEERARDTDCSFPYDYSDITFATRLPREIHSPYTFVYPFTATLWISVLLSILIFPIILKICMNRQHSLESLFFDVFGSFFTQEISGEFSTFINRLLIFSWIWFCFFITMSYSSVLLAFLTVPLKETGIRDLKSLSNAVRSGKMKAFLPEGSFLAQKMESHNETFVRLLAEDIAKNKWYLATEPKIAREHILKVMNAVFGSHRHLRILLGDDIFVSDDAPFTFPLTILLKRNSELKERINDLIKRITASGIYKKNLEDHLFRLKIAGKYDEEVEESTKNFTLGIHQMQGAFIVLVFGLGLTVCVFVMEVLYGKLKQKKSSKKNHPREKKKRKKVIRRKWMVEDQHKEIHRY